MLDLRLEPDLEQRLQQAAVATGRPARDIARDAILEAIEDCEDIAAAEAALANPGRRWTLEEIENKLDLKSDDVAG